MKGEEAKKLADGALEEFAMALDDGHSASLTAFLKTMARFHKYSVGNSLLIAMQRPDATHVAGFHAWKRLGRWVKAGEHGIAIVAPVVRKQRREAEAGEEEKTRIVCFKGCRVFDIAQTDGKPLADFATVNGDPSEYIEHLKSFVGSRGIGLTYASLSGPLGLSAGGRIILQIGLTPAEEFSTLAHELAHELLHKDENTIVARNIRELEAEAVAFVVCQAIGLDTNTAASDYIQLYQGDRKLLMASLERIRQTAAEIIEAIKLDKGGKSNTEQSDSTNHESSAESLAA